MDREFIEILKKILGNKTDLLKGIDKEIEKAINNQAKLNITNEGNNRVSIHVEGEKISILVLLASLEKAILEKTKCPETVWSYIKMKIGVGKDE